jgi:uncharacterized membrane protein YhaH (DUF805 family)
MTRNWISFLFGMRGRINRAQWWLAFLIVLAPFALASAAGYLFGDISITLPAYAGAKIKTPYLLALLFLIVVVLTLIAMVFILAAAVTKRFHDLDRNDNWAALFIGVPILLSIQVGGVTDIFLIGGYYVPRLIANAIFIWMVIWLGCIPGTSGPNQYGAEPLGARLSPSRSAGTAG